jgi:hypothetical protein
MPTFFGLIIYCISLIGCKESQFRCLAKYPISYLKYGLIIIMISAFFFFIQIYLYIKKIINFRQLAFTLISISFICFIYDTGSDFATHGSYNRIVLFFFIFIFYILYYIMVYLGKLLQKFPLTIISIILLVGFLINHKINKSVENSCYNWLEGFNGTKINNSSGNCRIPSPNICYFEIFDGVFDFSKYFGETCENTANNNPNETLMNLEPKLRNAKILGFPRSENWIFFPDSTYGNIQKLAMKEMVVMEDPIISNKIKDKIEVSVNYKKEKPEVKIDLKKDYQLIKRRKEIFKKHQNSVHFKNVLYVFIDSLSRVNFRRKLPKMWKWLEQKYHGG